jgi:NAD(P)-dependent dehydrogenase (short-subunit alcohol dehydrogenase family)
VLHGLLEDQALQESVDALNEVQDDTKFVIGDLTGPLPDSVQAIFDTAIQLQPGLDILVNNAGTYSENEFLEMDFETFDRTMKLNVYSHFFMTQVFAKHWVANGTKGRVLMTGSINGRLAEQTHAAYDTSKGAVEMMVRSLCVTLAPHGIRVNGMAPGLVRTPLTASALDQPGVQSWMEQHTPNQQVPGPEVCGPAAAFLVSDEACHIQGQMLLVDGGMSVWQQPDPE